MVYARGDIVLVPFPDTDLSAARVRPAVVVSSAVIADDLIVAMVTGRVQSGRHVVTFDASDACAGQTDHGCVSFAIGQVTWQSASDQPLNPTASP